MRQIESKGLLTQEWKDWLTECETETKSNIILAKNGSEITFSSLYKKKYIKENYFFTDKEPFFGKCAYCETPIEDIFPGDVEHYRPKGKVTDENYNEIYIQNEDETFILDNEGNKIPHPGYYWLAYEWSNLMPSCTYCNRPKKDFGKRNCFPVKGVSAFQKGNEKNENPLLIDPTDQSEAPETHLSLDFDTGLYIPKSKRGKITIEILGLNKRRYLVIGRRQAINDARTQLTKLIHNQGQRQEVLDEIEEYKKGNRPYSFAFVSVVKDFMAIKGLVEE